MKLQLLLAGLYVIQSGRWSWVLVVEEKSWVAHGTFHCYWMSWTCFVNQCSRTSRFQSTGLLLPMFTALPTENTSWHFIKPQFSGDFFLSHMWVAKRYPLLKVIFHSSVINAELTTRLLSWNSFWIHKIEGWLGAPWTIHYMRATAMKVMACPARNRVTTSAICERAQPCMRSPFSFQKPVDTCTCSH